MNNSRSPVTIPDKKIILENFIYNSEKGLIISKRTKNL